MRDVPRRNNVCNAVLYKTNTTGIKGVTVKKSNGKFYASAKVRGACVFLYEGDDLFEAVCCRKSFESHNDPDSAYAGSVLRTANPQSNRN